MWLDLCLCRGGEWVVPAAAAQCHITATQCGEQGGREGMKTERERHMKIDGREGGRGIWEEGEELENRDGG